VTMIQLGGGRRVPGSRFSLSLCRGEENSFTGAIGKMLTG